MTAPSEVPGCCGIAGCGGCAWECTHEDHNYVPSAKIGDQRTYVCGWCGNITPNLGTPTAAAIGSVTFTEWRVTGDAGEGYDRLYSFTWSTDRGDLEPEKNARAFIELTRRHPPAAWVDGPHLHHRQVTRGPWVEAGGEATP